MAGGGGRGTEQERPPPFCRCSGVRSTARGRGTRCAGDGGWRRGARGAVRTAPFDCGVLLSRRTAATVRGEENTGNEGLGTRPHRRLKFKLQLQSFTSR